MNTMTHRTETESTAEIIRAFISERFLYDRPEVMLTPDLPLIEQRLIDSLQLMQLVQFLQERFGIFIDIMDLVVENFASIDTMAAFVETQKR
jgi:acyl carrier protein